MVDPAGLANRAAFIRATAGYTGRRLLTPIGFRDDGHMSGTGHALGGFAYASGGQIHQAEAEATNKRLHGKFAGTTAMLRDLWTAAAPYYHASGKPMRSPIYTSGSDGLFVGVEQGAGRRPGHRNLYIPDWVVEGGKGDLNLGGRAPEALQLILHEWAHEYQSQSALARAARRVPKGVSVLGEGGRAVTAEGGAQAFAQMVGPAILAKAGMGDVHPRNYSAGDTYYQATDWVEKGLGSKWVRDGQFGYADGGFVGAPQMAGGGYVATAYGPPWGGIEGGGTTATGVDLGNAPHKYIIAVDPSEIPLGSEVKVWPNPFGYTGNFLAADTGGAIKGKRIDFYDWEGRAHQNAWGRRPVTVSVSGSVTGGSKKKAPSGLHLSGHQESTVQGYLGGAASEKSARVDFATKAGDVSGALEAGKARWAAQPADLKTSAGEHTAAARAEQVTISDKDVLRYYRDELKALQKEAKKWAKLRTFFRHLARRVHGSTKKQALDKAASYNAKITQAQSDAKTLKGTIYAQETTVIEAEGAEQAIPGEAKAAQANAAAEAAQGHESQLSGDLSAYQSDNSKVDLEVRAGVKTAAEGKAAKEANARKAEAGGYGELSPEGLLQVKGDLKELGEAAQDATSAIEAHTQAVKDNAKALDEYTKIASSENAIAAATFAKALADMVSGQLGGRPQVAGAGRGVPSGSAARY
jgi:3D (Asp-Asp-Asp) domain-containing protein